jgi:apolipoprotein N-acyltransferase
VWLIITLFGALLSGLWAGGMAWAGLQGWHKIICACALFSSLEVVWSWTPLYWTALGYTQSPDNLIILQISKLAGQQTVTAAIMAVNGLIGEAVLSKGIARKMYIYTCLGLVAIMGSYGLWSMYIDRAGDLTPIRAGIIQGNIANPVKLRPEGIQTAIDNYYQGYLQLAQSGAELILTPEVAIPLRYSPDHPSFALFRSAVQTYGVPLWLGAFGNLNPDRPDYTNSLFLLAKQEPTTPQYNKVRLVPVGEYIPFREIVGGLIRRLSPLRGEVVAGANDQIIDSPWGRLIMGICYESAYPQHFRYQAEAGGQLILTASNNAHYAESMPAQHHAQDVARAVETDRWAVRATNTGYSGIVDPKGRTIWRSSINTYEVHQETVYLRTSKTLYVQWGDWLTPLLDLISLAIVIKLRLLPSAPI